jgi:CheY-like chemotaxis protein
LDPVRVLLVDDEEEPRELARSALERLRVHVVTADGSEAALAVLAEHDFDAVVSDLWMGQRDGFALAEAVRLRHAEAPQLIALSNLPLFAAWERARLSGYDAYIQKPVSDAQLSRTLRQVLGRRRFA